MDKTIIKTENLSKTFSNGGRMQHVLKNIDLELFMGDFTVIMGASGAGKSTLLYALSGMDTPSLGKIAFGDVEISKFTPDQLAVFRRKHCGFVFQQIYLMEGMSVLDNALAAGLLTQKDKKALLLRAKELFAAVGIDEAAQKKFPSQISGGEAQRAGIVRALINSPEILFADEPTGALNSKTGLDVLNTLTEFNRAGQSVVMVTHDIRSARRGNRILYLKDGCITGELRLGAYTPNEKERHEKLTAFLQEMGW
ncbi:MAG: ABC transporter ATP-binding protein [Eubacterium sp.]|jgi:putative ABC transport system ATP-binding protein|nr:ABC transporter ATP-binding protein [Eubacterium sp.]